MTLNLSCVPVAFLLAPTLLKWRDVSCKLLRYGYNCLVDLLNCLIAYTVYFIFVFFDWQLKMGRGDELFPRNGRWNFNNKVLLLLSAVL